MDRRSATTARKKSYNIYCVNFYGNLLKPIKDQFTAQIRTGLRRTVFLIDINDIHNEYYKSSEMMSNIDNSNKIPESYLMLSIQNAIKNILQEYEDITQRIEDELKFNFYEYLLKNVEDKPKRLTGKLSQRKSMPNTAITSKNGKNKIKVSDLNEMKMECVQMEPQEHNHIGQAEKLSKKKFIVDHPALDKLYIIIIGNMDETLYLNLLRYNLPLQGIIHYVPIESKYDQLLGNNRTRNFIIETLRKIGREIYEERQNPILKSVGIFTHNIPIISDCSAQLYSRDIFDQLIWSIYDIEVLNQQYKTYYVTPFQETDVSIPSNISLQDFYEKAASMIVQGRYQKNEAPSCASDLATILFYLDSLLTTSTYAPSTFTERDVLGLSMIGLSKYAFMIPNETYGLTLSLENAFTSVAKLHKSGRLFVEKGNQVLTNMWLYVNQHLFKDIYRSCLDYNALRPYIMNNNILKSLKCLPFIAETLILPPIAKYYATHDSCCQRLTQLFEEYNDYVLEDLGNNNHLYTFRRPMNIIIENEDFHILPSCLCFRDFTLFQMQEFLKDFVTPKMASEKRDFLHRSDQLKIMQERLELDDNILIRPNSLQALLLQKKNPRKTRTTRTSLLSGTERLSNFKNSCPQNSEFYANGKTSTTATIRSNNLLFSHMDSDASFQDNVEENVFVGLPLNHNLLKGYNLEDVRQEIRVKTTKYYFKQGHLKLYEDFWCFSELNKNLILCINQIQVNIQKSKEYVNNLNISPQIRLVTRNNINLTIFNEPKQYSRFIMQYPNGLTVHYHDTYAEQIWLQETTPMDEQKRIMTPYGCVIVYYKRKDFILIMRYNGEIYALYQYELSDGEAEFEDVEEEEQTDIHIEDGSRKSINLLTNNAKKPDQIEKKVKSYTFSTDQDKIFLDKKLEKQTDKEQQLKMSIAEQLEFLQKLLDQYKLNFVYLIMTTTSGRIVHVTHAGKIRQRSCLKFKEWHDYCLDEIYVERNDGVKIIWSPKFMKCYHKDGTLFITKIAERFVKTEITEIAVDSSVSESSSHNDFQENNIQKLAPYFMHMSTEDSEKRAHWNKEYIYICSWLIHHKSYARVHMYWPLNATEPFLEIYGNDSIRLFIEKYIIPIYGEELTVENKETRICEEEGEEETPELGTVANVWIDNDLHLSIKDHTMNIKARIDGYSEMMEESGNIKATDLEEENIECIEEEKYGKINKKKSKGDCSLRNFMPLKIEFMNDITAVFHYLMNRFAQTLTNLKEVKTEELYFLERILPDCQTKGFEFVDEIPTMSTYKTVGTNYVMVFEKFRNIEHLMRYKDPMVKCDEAKFSKLKSSKKKSTEKKKLSWILSTSMYFEIPEYLRTNEQIAKFVEPLEETHFKTLRNAMKKLLDEVLHPEIGERMRILWSQNNWKIKKKKHLKRLFEREKRLGLYMAMLKHKTYPNYFKFINKYRDHVKNINFFEFTLNECRNRDVPKEQVYFPPCEKPMSKKHKRKPHF